MFLFLNQNLWVVYVSVCMCMLLVLHGCFTFIEYRYQKKYRIDSIEGKILSIVSNWKYLVSPTPINTWSPLPRKQTQTRDGPIPIPNIWYHRYWLTLWWYRYAPAVSKCFDTCVRRTAHAQNLRFHTIKRKLVMPSGGDSGGNWIFLSIEHVLRNVNMFLFLNQNLGVVYLSVCRCMLSTCLSCIEASLLLSIGIEKSIVSTVSKVKYSVSYQTERTLYRPPLTQTPTPTHTLDPDQLGLPKIET